MSQRRTLRKSGFKKIQANVDRNIRDAFRILDQYEICQLQANKNLAKEKALLAGHHVRNKFRNTPISELTRIRKGIPLTILDSCGFRHVDDLAGRSIRQLSAYRGIGEKKAMNIVAAVEQYKDECAATTRMPLYEELVPEHINLLETLFNSNELARIDVDLAHVEKQLSSLKAEWKNSKKSASWYRLLVGGKKAANNATAKHLLLADSTREFFQRYPIHEMESTLVEISNRKSFTELKELYARYNADYSAIFYRDARHRVTRSGGIQRLGLPSDALAEQVETVNLDVRGLGVTLRGYQEFGIKYLVHQGRTVLGDEMGLGKTIQALGAIIHLQNTLAASHFLIVAPAGLTPNWEKEISLRTQLSTWRLHGPDRQMLLKMWQRDGGIAIISYATLRNTKFPDGLAVHMVIGDEAHYVKNPTSKRTQAFAEIAEQTDFVSLLSGTPMENTPNEFVNVIRTLGEDRNSGINPAQKPDRALTAGAAQFAEAVSPVYLRRKQTDVLHELPEKLEIEEWVELEGQERSNYDYQVEFGHAMHIRQATTTSVNNSAKLARLTELLDFYSDEGQKVVIFSFFHSALDAVCELAPINYRIDGGKTAVDRQKLIDEFSAEPDFAILVSQIDAGGVGLNIQAANVVILMEPQLKPTTEWQAIARVHRMGQARRVIVHRLLAVDTIDERLTARLHNKAAIFEAFAANSNVKDSIAAATNRQNVRHPPTEPGADATNITENQLIAMERDALAQKRDQRVQAML